MDQSVTEATTLWSLLVRPTIGLHFPRFALFILVAIPVELFCDIRSRCFTCSFTTILLQLLVGVSTTVASYYFYTTYYDHGDRMRPPSWYFPLTSSVILLAVVSFSIGIRRELRKRQFLTCALRSVTFFLTVIFAITTMITPFEVNSALEKMETQKQNKGRQATATTSPAT